MSSTRARKPWSDTRRARVVVAAVVVVVVVVVGTWIGAAEATLLRGRVGQSATPSETVLSWRGHKVTQPARGGTDVATSGWTTDVRDRKE